MDDGRTKTFLSHLYREKEIHKEQRHKHVVHKLVLSGSFFGLSQLTSNPHLFHLFLYIVPFVALVHDSYIFAEHFKVHRVGIFLRKLECPPACKEELDWEKFAHSNPERNAKWASFTYTILVTTFSVLAIYYSDYKGAGVLADLFYYWVGLCVISTLAVFGFSINLRIKIRDIEDGFK